MFDVSNDPAQHGERRRYTAGCRCPACTEENTLYQRRYRARTMPTVRATYTRPDGSTVTAVQRPLPFGPA